MSENIAIQICIVLKRSGNLPDLTFSLRNNATVIELKDAVVQLTGMDLDEIRLIHMGSILQDDFDLPHYDIKDGSSLHLVRIASNKALDQAADAQGVPQVDNGMPSDYNSIMNNTLFKSLSKNPEILKGFLMNNPQIKQLAERNPELNHMLSDPSFMKQTMDMARNPEKMKEVMRNNDRAISNLEMLPNGFNQLRKMYHSLQEPMENANRLPDNSTDASNLLFAKKLNVHLLDKRQVNGEALPNPWNANSSTSSFEHRRGYELGGLSSSPFSFSSRLPTSFTPSRRTSSQPTVTTTTTPSVSIPINAPQTSEVPPQIRFRNQLERMEEMGFSDTVANLAALEAVDGDVDNAVVFLLENNQ